MTDRITIRRPDDWHVHLRDGDMLKAVVGYTARQFRRAIVMPNLKPPVTTPAMAQAYRARILEALPPGSDFDPLITCYLTNDTDPDVIAQGFESGAFAAAKLYPANATTNSAFGVTDIEHIFPVLARMEEIGMPFLVHGEVTDHEVDVFDREAVFIDRIFSRLSRASPSCGRCLNISRPKMPRSLWPPPGPILPRPSPPSISTSAAMTCWSAAFARIFIACPY